MIAACIEDIPEAFRPRFQGLMSLPPKPISEVRAALATHLAIVRQLAPLMPLMDPAQAEQIRAVAEAHLESATGDGLALVLAACAYFLEEDPDEEITGVLGFADDIAVFNAVSRAVGRPELVIAIPRGQHG